MAELHEHIVAGLHDRQNLPQAAGPDETVSPLAALGIIRYRDGRVEEPREHLTPAGPGLVVLIHHRRVSAKEYGGHAGSRLDAYLLHRGCVASHLYGQAAVPVQFAEFARLEPHLTDFAAVFAYYRIPLVDHEAHGLELPFRRLQVVDEQAAGLGLDESGALVPAAAYPDCHEPVAVGQRDVEVERDLRLVRIIGVDNGELLRLHGKGSECRGAEK